MQKFLCTIFLCFFTCIVMVEAQDNPASHTVVKGETLYSISKLYHVTVAALEKANGMSPNNFKIKPGQKIKLPGASAAAAPEKKTETKTTTTTTTTKTTKTVSAAKPTAEPTESKPASNPGTHTVVKGETVYSLSKMYGVKVKDIKLANHLPDDMKLKLGQKLIIPAANPEAAYKPAAAEPKEVKEVPKETKPTVAETKPEKTKAGGDENPFVVPGKKQDEPGRDYLKSEPEPVKKEAPKQGAVKQDSPEPVKPADTKPVAPKSDTPKEVSKETQKEAKDEPKATGTNTFVPDIMRPSEYPAMFAKYEGSGKKKTIYRGIGTFMQNENPGNQYLALYNYAETNTILKVTNLMSKQSIYVKVVGKVPAPDAQNEVILKLSTEAASQLKVTEDKFLVEVIGYTP